MTYKADANKFEGEKDLRTVCMRRLPFAQGGERNAYHLWDTSAERPGHTHPEQQHYVVKESRFHQTYASRLGFHRSNFRASVRNTRNTPVL
jgi:hypothetical protein